MTDNTKNGSSFFKLKGYRKLVPFIIGAVTLFILFCLTTNSTGAFGSWIDKCLTGLFSVGAYFLPAFLLLHAFLYAKDYLNQTCILRIILSLVTLLFISMFSYSVSSVDYGFEPKMFFNDGISSVGGGFIGGILAYGFEKVIGSVGVIILSIVVFVVYLAYTFNSTKEFLSKAALFVLTKISDFEKHREEKKELQRQLIAAEEKKRDDAARENLMKDDFFSSSSEMSELSIEKLGIREIHAHALKNGETSKEIAEAQKDEPKEETKEKEISKRRDNSIFDYGIDASLPGGKGAAFSSTALPNGAFDEEKADDVFGADFDGFDFKINQDLAQKPSSKEAVKKASEPISEIATPIHRISEEDIEKARRLADFEMKKKAAIEAREEMERIAKALPEEETLEFGNAPIEPELNQASVETYTAPSATDEPRETYTAPSATDEPRETYTAPSVTDEPRETYTAPSPTDEPREIYTAPSATDEPRETYTAPSATDEPRETYTAPSATDEPRETYTAPSSEEAVTESPEKSLAPQDEPYFSENSEEKEADFEKFTFEITPNSLYDAEPQEFSFAEDTSSQNEKVFESEDTESNEDAGTFTIDSTENDVSEGESEFIPSDILDKKIENELSQIGDGEPTIIMQRELISENDSEDIYEDESENLDKQDIGEGVFESSEDEKNEEAEYETAIVPDDDDTDGEYYEEIPPNEQNPDILEYRKMFSFLEDEIEDKEAKNEEGEPIEEGGTDLVQYRDEDIVIEDMQNEEKPPFEIKNEFVLPKDNKPAPEKKKEPEAPKPDYSKYKFPPIDLLRVGQVEEDLNSEEETKENAEKLVETLAQFSVKVSLKGYDRGPRITRYEIVPAKGVKVNQVTNLFDDIALSMAAEGIRMEAPIPGKSAIGVEIPNRKPSLVFLRDLIETDEFMREDSKTCAAIGKDVTGNPVIGDISKMPHVLIAGATGMGKSVCINAVLISILYKARPDEVKFIMIDPKRVEFNSYNGIPHLLIPVVTDVKQAAGALMWAVEQMEKRYDLMGALEVKKLDEYNELVKENPSLGEPLPKIIIVIDELNDIMLQARKPVEGLIMSIAQKARAAGIHLILGTQRPSVDVITGVIKSNIPSRISCKVMSFQDSKTIIDQAGAEKLLNNGDMLYFPNGSPKPLRVQGAYVSNSEVSQIMRFLKEQMKGQNIYDQKALDEINNAAKKCVKGGAGDDDSDDGDEGENVGILNDQQFLDAVDLAIKSGKISTSLIQRRIGVGYGKAAKFIDYMEDFGIVSEPNGQKPRDILIDRDTWHEMLARRAMD